LEEIHLVVWLSRFCQRYRTATQPKHRSSSGNISSPQGGVTRSKIIPGYFKQQHCNQLTRMSHSTDIVTLAHWMAADFSNQEQALIILPFLLTFASVCALPLEVLSGVSFFVEQAYDYILNDPYRVRVLKLVEAGDRIEIENYTVKQEDQFYGASRDRDRLKALTSGHLEKLLGCNMIVEWTGHSFIGAVEPGKACMVVRKGKRLILTANLKLTKINLAASTGDVTQKLMSISGVCGGTILLRSPEQFC
jgi:hypothetical protein